MSNLLKLNNYSSLVMIIAEKILQFAYANSLFTAVVRIGVNGKYCDKFSH